MTDVDMLAASKLPLRGDELFRIFARFEYALKKCGYGAPTSARNNACAVGWGAFANKELGDKFFRQIGDQQIAPTILTSPPRVQICTDRLNWIDKHPPANVQDLFGAVCRVRNNLFHGGKSESRDADRNAILVAEAIAILIEALKTSDELRAYFEGRK